MELDWVDEVADLLGRYDDDEVINTRWIQKPEFNDNLRNTAEEWKMQA
jgi:hypothetical protein